MRTENKPVRSVTLVPNRPEKNVTKSERRFKNRISFTRCRRKQNILEWHMGRRKEAQRNKSQMCWKILNWKALGTNGAQGYWIKKETMYGRIATRLSDALHGKEKVPEWMTCGKTICQRHPNKVDNFKIVSWSPIMWKLMTGVAAEVLRWGKHITRGTERTP